MSISASSARPRVQEGGFTLIELVVVVSIVCILSGLAMPRLGQARVMAEAARAAEQMHHVEEAVLMVIAERGASAFPTRDSGIFPHRGDLEQKLASTGLGDYLTPEDFDLGWGQLMVHNNGARSGIIVAVFPLPPSTDQFAEPNSASWTFIRAIGKIFGHRWHGTGGQSGHITVWTES